jgi:mono/diheme cytochrome c family protein
MMWALSIAVLTLLVLAPPAAAADLELGKKVYGQKCANCHGPDGKGNAKMAAALKVEIKPLAAAADKPEAEVRKLLEEGKKPMPAYGKTLSPAELDAVLAYTKDLAGK